MKKIFTLICLSAFVSVGFSQTTSNPPCNGIEANFTHEIYAPAGGIQFTNTSVVPTGQTVTYEWNFGNGNTSADKDAFNMYDEGTYTVMLKVTDQDGCSVSTEKQVEFTYGGK